MWSNLPSHPHRVRLVLGLVVLTLGVGALALPSLGRMDMRGVSIIDVEMMRTRSGAADVLARLGDGGIDATRMSLYLDFPFLVLYALTLSAACIVVAASQAERGGVRRAKLGPPVAWLAVVAASFDAIENLAILLVLGGSTDQPWPGIAFGFATAKFVLLAVVILYLLVGVFTGRREKPAEVDAAP